jgi:CO/xanthine dehydrogenase FAD-binding subunit
MRPQTVIDIDLLKAAHERIELGRSGLRLGALVRMADAADHPQIRGAISGHRAVAPTRTEPANPQPWRQRVATHSRRG